MSNIVIIGGGTAGWITALYAKQIYPDSKVTVIASEEIGVLGAGESTTPMFIDFLDIIKIPFYELIRNCEATLKVSAKFSNWNKDGGYYYNSFAADEDLAISTLNSFIDPVTQYNSRAIIYSIAKNNKQHQFDFNSNLAENNKFPFSINSDRLAHFSLNFDARLVAEYFKKIAIEERGIFYIDDEIISFEENSNKEIVKINCKSNAVHSDFVFDCSGFKRLLIGKYYNSEWKSYSEHLPADKAFPFFLSHEQMGKGVTSHINAVAMKYGWMWQIPIQSRYGCGYVFDSSYITLEEAKKEVEEYFGFEVQPPRQGLFFEFNPGSFKNVWIKNCIAVGLSSAFIEPLEATSILSSLQSLKRLPGNIEDLLKATEPDKNNFNAKFRSDQEEILNFIYLHYVTNRDDTEFWKNFTINNKMPDFTKQILSKSKNNILEYKDFEGTNIFALENYLFVMQGNGILNLEPYIKEFNNTYSEEENKNYEIFKIKQNLTLQTSANWQQVLKMIEDRHDAVK